MGDCVLEVSGDGASPMSTIDSEKNTTYSIRVVHGPPSERFALVREVLETLVQKGHRPYRTSVAVRQRR